MKSLGKERGYQDKRDAQRKREGGEERRVFQVTTSPSTAERKHEANRVRKSGLRPSQLKERHFTKTQGREPAGVLGSQRREEGGAPGGENLTEERERGRGPGGFGRCLKGKSAGAERR